VTRLEAALWLSLFGVVAALLLWLLESNLRNRRRVPPRLIFPPEVEFPPGTLVEYTPHPHETMIGLTRAGRARIEELQARRHKAEQLRLIGRLPPSALAVVERPDYGGLSRPRREARIRMAGVLDGPVPAFDVGFDFAAAKHPSSKPYRSPWADSRPWAHG
jgi:hypothetical protein